MKSSYLSSDSITTVISLCNLCIGHIVCVSDEQRWMWSVFSICVGAITSHGAWILPNSLSRCIIKRKILLATNWERRRFLNAYIITTSQRSCGKVIFSVLSVRHSQGGSPCDHYPWCHLSVTGHVGTPDSGQLWPPTRAYTVQGPLQPHPLIWSTWSTWM